MRYQHVTDAIRAVLWGFGMILAIGAAPAQASSFMTCEGEGTVISARPATPQDASAPQGWLIEVKAGTARYVEGMGSPLFGICWGARKTVTIAHGTEKKAGEKLRIQYHTYSGMGAEGPVSAETWSIMDGPAIKGGVPKKTPN